MLTHHHIYQKMNTLSLGSSHATYDKLFCYIHKKHNTWIFFCACSYTVFLIDPPDIQQQIVDCIYSLQAKKYYYILTRHHRTKLENLKQWIQLFPFQLLAHNQAYFDYNIHSTETQQKESQSKIEQNIANVTLIRGKYDIDHCLLAYKKPFLFCGEILQRQQDNQLHYHKISKTILNFLQKIPKDTIILPSTGPIELLEFLPISFTQPRDIFST